MFTQHPSDIWVLPSAMSDVFRHHCKDNSNSYNGCGRMASLHWNDTLFTKNRWLMKHQSALPSNHHFESSKIRPFTLLAHIYALYMYSLRGIPEHNIIKLHANFNYFSSAPDIFNDGQSVKTYSSEHHHVSWQHLLSQSRDKTKIFSYSHRIVFLLTMHLLSIECADWLKLHDMINACAAKSWQW